MKRFLMVLRETLRSIRAARASLVILSLVMISALPLYGAGKNAKRPPKGNQLAVCTKKMGSLSLKRVAYVGGATLAAATAIKVLKKKPVEIFLVGEFHDERSDGQRSALLQRFRAGEILLASENLMKESEKFPRAEKLFGRPNPNEMIGIESNLPHELAEFDVFKRAQARRIVFTRSKTATASQILNAFAEHLIRFQALLAQETVLEVLESLRAQPAQHHELLRICDLVMGPEGSTRLEGLGNPSLGMEMRIASLPQEILDLFSSEEVLVALFKFTDYLDKQYVLRLKAVQNDKFLQIPPEVIRYFEQSPSFLAPNVMPFFQGPWDAREPISELIGVTWRNAVMIRNLEPVILRARAESKSLYVLMGHAHVKDFESQIRKAYPSENISVTPQ